MTHNSCESCITPIKSENFTVYFIENFYVHCNCGECDVPHVNSAIKIRDLNGKIIKKITGGNKVRLLQRRTPYINRKHLNDKDSESFRFIEKTVLEKYNLIL